MRFVLSVASKYLTPKWRQLSVSIISLISIVVVSLVVWLTIVFMSVSDGMRQSWVSQLISLNAPVRMTPTDAYYTSYYYKVDSLSSSSGYSTRSIGEKLAASVSDPYDPNYDMELPSEFPLADRRADGSLKDPVKMGWEIAEQIQGVRPQEYEVAAGNLRLNLFRDAPGCASEETCISQVSYFLNVDPENQRFQSMVLPPTPTDYNNLLAAIPTTHLVEFFESMHLKAVRASDDYFPLNSNLYPHNGTLKGCGILRNGEVSRVVIPGSAKEVKALCAHFSEMGHETMPIDLQFQNGMPTYDYPFVAFDKEVTLKAQVVPESLRSASSHREIMLQVEGEVQGVYLSGSIPMNHLEIADAEPSGTTSLWAYESDLPVDGVLGDGVIISRSYLKNGVRLGDQGYLSYIAPTPTSTHEQRLPIYVAGFYDPGLVALGNKFTFVDPKLTSSLRGSMSMHDSTMGNGINLWVGNIREASKVKNALIAQLESAGIAQYWDVESYHDYDFVKPIMQQLSSDKTLFSLIAIMILLVACSNIISMLILLVNDKRREIGIMRSMGASKREVASIFGLCGFIMGIFSCLIGGALALFTIHNLDMLVHALNFINGKEMFQSAFYGGSLPKHVSWDAVLFVLSATLVLSLIAGLIPAYKASKVSPTESLRGD